MYAPLRVSEDGGTNTYGKMLFELCTTFSLQILNGACKAESKGQFTFVSEVGCSAVDYFLVSSCLFYDFIEVMKIKFSEKIEMTCMPLELSIKKSGSQTVQESEDSSI